MFITSSYIILNSEIITSLFHFNNFYFYSKVETLQSKLEEAIGDINALRKQLQKKEEILNANGGNKKYSNFVCSSNDYEQLVQELEKFQKKVSC